MGQVRREPIVTGLVYDNIQRFFKLVEIEFLGHYSEVLFGRGKILVYIHIEHCNPASRLGNQRAYNTDRSGFAGTVGAQQCKEVPLLHLQADTLS